MNDEGSGLGGPMLHRSAEAAAAAIEQEGGRHVWVVSERSVREWHRLVGEGTAGERHVVKIGGEFRDLAEPGTTSTRQVGPGTVVTAAREPIEESWIAAIEEALEGADDPIVVIEDPTFLLTADAPEARLAELRAIADRAPVHVALPAAERVNVGRLARTVTAADEETHRRLADDGIEHLRTIDPTNFGYLRSNWREARRGLEAVEMTYPQSKQVHDAIPDPKTTPRTLGAALKGLVELGALDVWGDTVAANRYDMTAYDPERTAAVGAAIERLDE